VVTNNAERHAIIREQVRQYAQLHGLPVISWHLQLHNTTEQLFRDIHDQDALPAL